MSKDIFPSEAWELISKNRKGDDLVIIDVSTPQEYKDLHLNGAINMSLISRFFKARLGAMEKSKTYMPDIVLTGTLPEKFNMASTLNYPHKDSPKKEI